MTIREYLKNNHIITDGSFGTYYAERYDTQEMSEYANPSFEAQIQVLKTACPELTIMTPEEIISEKYGYTITDEEKEELVRALYIINYGVENLEQLLHKDDKLLEDQEIDPEETQTEEIVVEEE